MALKDDLKAVKKSLSAEEQMIENFIKGEKFFKKYKYYLLAFILALILYFVYAYFSDTYKIKTRQQNNDLYSSLMQNPDDEEKLALLKEKSPNLYAFFLLSHSELSAQNLEELSKLKLEPLFLSILEANENNNSPFLKDYKKILQAYELLKENKIEQAQILLAQIPLNSPLKELANNFRHYKGLKQ